MGSFSPPPSFINFYIIIIFWDFTEIILSIWINKCKTNLALELHRVPRVSFMFRPPIWSDRCAGIYTAVNPPIILHSYVYIRIEQTAE